MVTVTVTFTIEANSPQHAEEVVRRYLEQKGVTARGTVELTPKWVEQIDGVSGLGHWEPRHEERFGYDEIRATYNQTSSVTN